MRHQQCQHLKYTASVDIEKMPYKKLSHSCRITYKCSESFKSREQCYIKATTKKRHMLPVETLGSMRFEHCMAIVSHMPPLVDDSLRSCGHRFEFSVRQRIFLPESTSSADFHGVRAAPGCNHMHSASMRMLKIPNTSSHTTVWTQ